MWADDARNGPGVVVTADGLYYEGEDTLRDTCIISPFGSPLLHSSPSPLIPYPSLSLCLRFLRFPCSFHPHTLTPGFFFHNRLMGHALLLFADGSCYDGEFSGDLHLLGRGVLVSPSGLALEGYFQGLWGDRAGVKVGITVPCLLASSLTVSFAPFSMHALT